MKTALVCERGLVQQAITKWLDGSDLDVVVSEATPIKAVGRARQRGLMLDLLVVVQGEPSRNLRERMARVRAAFPACNWLLLDSEFNLERMTDSFNMGFQGYLLKDLSREALLAAAGLLMAGEKVFPSCLVPFLLGASPVMRLSRCKARRATLTPQETAVVRWLSLGLSDKEIASELNIAESTVASHLKALRRKLHLQNRTQVALWAAGAAPRPCALMRHRSSDQPE